MSDTPRAGPEKRPVVPARRVPVVVRIGNEDDGGFELRASVREEHADSLAVAVQEMLERFMADLRALGKRL